MNFKEKVQSMTGAEILLAMIEGLENPSVKVNMETFGELIDGVCFGCAATNAVCKISGVTFAQKNIYLREQAFEDSEEISEFLSEFEGAIDWLRCGSVGSYNSFAKSFSCNEIPEIEFYLPVLCTYNYREGLAEYRKYYELIKDMKND